MSADIWWLQEYILANPRGAEPSTMSSTPSERIERTYRADHQIAPLFPDVEPFIACDLDGTLAHYTKFYDSLEIGVPIPAMVELVQRWIAEGRAVRIFTARVSQAHDHPLAEIITAIEDWCLQHIGVILPITNVKSGSLLEFFDDRAVQVQKNTGEIVGYSTRGSI